MSETTEEMSEEQEQKKEKSSNRTIIAAFVAFVVFLLTACAYIIYESGAKAGKLEARGEMLLSQACERNYSIRAPFMDTHAKQLALQCHDVEICLRVDGKVMRCDSVTCETGDRCD